MCKHEEWNSFFVFLHVSLAFLFSVWKETPAAIYAEKKKTYIETLQDALPCLWIAYADVNVNAKKLMKLNKSRSQILYCIKEMICYQTYRLQRIMSVYSDAYEQSAESSSIAQLKIMDDFSSDKEVPSKWYLLPWSRLSNSKYVTVAEKL